jgi:hypothetical protein
MSEESFKVTTVDEFDLGLNLSLLIERREEQLELQERKRKSKTIHFSSFWKCPRNQLAGPLGYQFTNWLFKWPNREAAKSGDSVHERVQEQARSAGLLVQVPSSVPDQITRDLHRDNGILQPAIEVTLEHWLYPYTPHQTEIYRRLGIIVPERDAYDELMSFWLGGRLDTVVILPGYYDDVPGEFKTLYGKYWPKSDNEKRMLSATGRKWYEDNQVIYLQKKQHYYFQLQMQLHFSRSTKTGKRPKYGLIYIINRDDTSRRIQEIVEYDPEFIARWLPVIAEIRDAWRDGILPPGRPGEDCTFCEIWDNCDHPAKKEFRKDWKTIKRRSVIRKMAEETYLASLVEVG